MNNSSGPRNKKGPSFKEWVEGTYASPRAILTDCLQFLNENAAEIDASFDQKTIDNIPDHAFSERGSTVYLKNRRGGADGKAYAVIKLGTTGNGDVFIPLVKVIPYRSSLGDGKWFSPAKHLWGRYKSEVVRARHEYKPTYRNGSASYASSVQSGFNAAASMKNSEQELLDAAHNAAALAITKLQANSQLLQNSPAVFNGFHLPGSLGAYPERIISSTIEVRLYSRAKSEWTTRAIAYPRDLFVPMTDLESGEIANAQIISARPPHRKRFLAGAKFTGTAALLLNPEASYWVVCEGYKTGRSIHATDASANVAPAMSANNTPVVVALLAKLYPGMPIYTANDNDDDGTKYANKASLVGAKRIPAPNLFDGSDWADLRKQVGPEAMASAWFTALRAAT